jgi:hypothetical protein
MKPACQTSAGKYAAFYNISVNREGDLEKFVFCQKSSDVLSADVAREILQSLWQRNNRGLKSLTERLNAIFFPNSMLGLMVAH